MKKITKLIPLILSFSLSLSLTSCANISGSSEITENKTVVFCGSFSVDETYIRHENISVRSARSAQPAIPPDEDLTYYAKATNGTETIVSNDIDASDKSFSIPLKAGSTWTIEVGAKGTSAVDSSITDAVLIKDSISFNPDTASDHRIEYKFNLVPQITEAGRGKINLRIKIQNPSENKIEKVEIVPKKCLNKPEDEAAVTEGWSELTSFWDSDKHAVCFTSSLDDFTVSGNSFKSGIWEVAVNFKDQQEQLLYSSIQTICVYDNLETKTWESSKTVAASNELIVSTGEDAGVLYLTTLLVDAYGLTDFYVSGVMGYDLIGNGSPMKPFASIEKAIAVVNGLNRLDKTYTIHVKDGVSQIVSEPIVVTANLSIECYSVGQNNTHNYGDRKGTATITSESTTGPIIQIGNGDKAASLTIEGTRNTNNTPDDISDDTWTGLQLVSLSNIRQAMTTRGVSINANGALFMNGGAITGNSILGSNPGAGVEINPNAYFVFTGGRISGNSTSTGNGGGIYVHSGGDMLIKGGVITGNTAVNGAGIYVEGNITIGGTCYISGNTASSDASNIYLPNDKLIKISGKIDGSTIGITTQTAPSVGNNVRITQGYAYGKEWGQNKNDDETYNHPFKYFHSDVTGYSILTDPTPEDPNTPEYENNGDAYLGISGGTITPYSIPQLTISLTENGNEYTISATSTDTDWTGCNSENTNASLKYNGTEIARNTFWTYDEENCKVDLLNTLPAETYVLEVDVTYNSRVYTATFNITKS